MSLSETKFASTEGLSTEKQIALVETQLHEARAVVVNLEQQLGQLQQQQAVENQLAQQKLDLIQEAKNLDLQNPTMEGFTLLLDAQTNEDVGDDVDDDAAQRYITKLIEQEENREPAAVLLANRIIKADIKYSLHQFFWDLIKEKFYESVALIFADHLAGWGERYIDINGQSTKIDLWKYLNLGYTCKVAEKIIERWSVEKLPLYEDWQYVEQSPFSPKVAIKLAEMLSNDPKSGGDHDADFLNFIWSYLEKGDAIPQVIEMFIKAIDHYKVTRQRSVVIMKRYVEKHQQSKEPEEPVIQENPQQEDKGVSKFRLFGRRDK